MMSMLSLQATYSEGSWLIGSVNNKWTVGFPAKLFLAIGPIFIYFMITKCLPNVLLLSVDFLLDNFFSKKKERPNSKKKTSNKIVRFLLMLGHSLFNWRISILFSFRTRKYKNIAKLRMMSKGQMPATTVYIYIGSIVAKRIYYL